MDDKEREQILALIDWLDSALNAPAAVLNPRWKTAIAERLREFADTLDPPETPDEEVT